MKLTLSSDNMSVTESMKFLAEQKLDRLDRLWVNLDPEAILVRVVMNSAPQNNFLVKIEANVVGEKLFADAQQPDLEAAMVAAVEELTRGYVKYKEKLTNRDWEVNREQKVFSEDNLEDMIQSQE